MANKIYNYDTPSEFTYDNAKIDVSGGIASLRENLSSVYARYHLNESSGDNVPDSSGNGRDGICVNMEDADWMAGKLNNCLLFDGINEFVDCGDIAGFDRNEPFTLECWFKTGSSGAGTMLSKIKSIPNYSGYWFYFHTGKIIFRLWSDPGQGMYIKTVNLYNDNEWHHVIATYDGSSLAAGLKIYIDGSIADTTIELDNLTSSILVPNNFQIGVGGAGVYPFNGLLDEAVIYDKELFQAEVTYRYNSGNGRENVQYYSDLPTIEPTDLYDPATVTSWDSFLETLGGGNEGSIGYNLYKVDKINKYYWNGSVWVIGGSSSNYNSASVVNDNINAFDASPDKIGFIAYLISDGEQEVELDENQITYSVNLEPIINAGSNKSCKDNDTISPFSDCSFSDPDGTVDHAHYKVDGEVDVWTEILQGGYGTLVEAVQAWTYIFDNTGTKTVRLQVEDNEGVTSDDSLEVDVQKFQVIFNIKNSSGIHLPNINFNPDDGSGWQIVDSPFTYEFDYNASGYDVIINKTNYITQTKNVPSTDHTENFTLVALEVDVTRVYCPLRIDINEQRPIVTIRPIKHKINITAQCYKE